MKSTLFQSKLSFISFAVFLTAMLGILYVAHSKSVFAYRTCNYSATTLEESGCVCQGGQWDGSSCNPPYDSSDTVTTSQACNILAGGADCYPCQPDNTQQCLKKDCSTEIQYGGCGSNGVCLADPGLTNCGSCYIYTRSCRYTGGGGGGENNPDITVQITNPANKTRVINQGDTAVYSVTVASVDGFSGNVTLAASSCPTNAACTFSDNTFYLPSNGSTSVSFMISNTANTPVNNYTGILVSGSGSGVADADTAVLQVNGVPIQRGNIAGFKVVMPNNQPVAPAAGQTVRLDGASPTTANYYSYNDITAGNHTVSVTVPLGWTVKSTLCYQPDVGCHSDGDASSRTGSSRTISILAGRTADLWWHFYPPVNTGNSPIGSHDVTDCNQVVGWACDADDFNQSVTIRIYDGDANNGGTFLDRVTANQAAVNSADAAAIAGMCGNRSARRFFYTLPSSVRSSGSHTIYVYAINSIGGGSSRPLTGTPKAVPANCGGPVTRTLTVTRQGTGTGTVTGNGISCGSDCSQTYANGTNVTLRATASSGSTFVSWAGCNTVNGNDCSVTMDAVKTVTATFNRGIVCTAGQTDTETDTQNCGSSACSGTRSRTRTRTCNASGTAWGAWGAWSAFGACSTQGDVCGAATACTNTRVCDANGACGAATNKPNGPNAACNDGSACTTDACQNGVCQNTASGTHKQCQGNRCVTVPNTAGVCTDTCANDNACIGPIRSFTVTSNLTFTAQQGSLPSPAFQDITVTNTGNQPLTINIAESIGWAGINRTVINNLSPSAPGNTATVRVTVTDSTLGSGTYSGIVNFTNSQGAAGQSTNVRYTVTALSEKSLSVDKQGTGTGVVTSSPAGINCGNACSDSFAAGANVTLTAASSGSSTFAGWSANCTPVSGNPNQCRVTMNTNETVIATFSDAGPSNRAPSADAKISDTNGNWRDSITVTRGQPTPIYLSATGSTDPDGWTHSSYGMSGGGAKCEWNYDLDQSAFSVDQAVSNPSTVADCGNFSANGSLKTFNDAPGTYTYPVLRLTDRANGVSSVATVRVTVETPPTFDPPPSVHVNKTACEQITVSWTGVSGAAEYRVYRGTAGDGSNAVLIRTVSAPAISYAHTTGPGLYYYFVSAVSPAGVESQKTRAAEGQVTADSCEADMGSSDKDIVGRNSQSWLTGNGDCDRYTGAPSSLNIVYRDGDRVKFEINLCNNDGEAAAIIQSVVDTLSNMGKPATGWNARYQDAANASQWHTIDPAEGASGGNTVLTFTFPSGYAVPRRAVRKLTFEAQLGLPGSTDYARFYNTALITYRLRPSDPATATELVSTPPLLFFGEGGDPNRFELPPN